MNAAATNNLPYVMLGVGGAVYCLLWGIRKETPSALTLVVILGVSFLCGQLFIGLSFLMADGDTELPSTYREQTTTTASATPRRWVATPAPTPPALDLQNSPLRNIQEVVKRYVLARAALPASVQFLQWSDFAADGSRGYVTLHYSLLEKSGKSVEARARFSVAQGQVMTVEMVR